MHVVVTAYFNCRCNNISTWLANELYLAKMQVDEKDVYLKSHGSSCFQIPTTTVPWKNKYGNFTWCSAHQYAYGSDTKTHKKPDTELFYFQTQVVTLRYLNMGISTEFTNRWAVGKGTDLIREHSSVDSQFWKIRGRPVWSVGPTSQTGLFSCNPSRLCFIL